LIAQLAAGVLIVAPIAAALLGFTPRSAAAAAAGVLARPATVESVIDPASGRPRSWVSAEGQWTQAELQAVHSLYTSPQPENAAAAPRQAAATPASAVRAASKAASSAATPVAAASVVAARPAAAAPAAAPAAQASGREFAAELRQRAVAFRAALGQALLHNLDALKAALPEHAAPAAPGSVPAAARAKKAARPEAGSAAAPAHEEYSAAHYEVRPKQ
jgi:hypothetical protein